MRKITNEELGRPTPEAYAAMEKMAVTVVLDNVRSMQNVGAFFGLPMRSGSSISLCVGLRRPRLPAIFTKLHWGPNRPCRGATTNRPRPASTLYTNEATSFMPWSRSTGATMLGDFRPEAGRRYALVFGNEVDGVEQEAVDRCDGAIEIPQMGVKHSLNVSVSGGVVLWDFFWRIRPNR